MADKLKIEVIRRIENIIENDTFPKVGPMQENHIDDNWLPEQIYKGEILLDIKNNKFYTSDGREIIQLNTPTNHILSGLEIKRPVTSGDGISLDIMIENGTAIINNRLCKFESDELISNFKIDLTGTQNEADKFCFIFGTYDSIEDPFYQTEQYLDITIEQFIVQGSNYVSNFNQLDLKILSGDITGSLLYKTPTELGLITNDKDYTSNKYLLLGIVFIPARYNENSLNVLEPISLSNFCSSYPLQEKSHCELLSDRINTIDVWGQYKVFYKTQIIRKDNVLYMVHKTFGNGSNTNISTFLITDGTDDSASDSASDSAIQSNILGYVSKIGFDYSNEEQSLPGGTQYWKKIETHIKYPTNTNFYKYIVGIVPNLDPSGIGERVTVDLPDITVNGVKFTVGYNNTNKDNAQVYFAKVGTYTSFNENNYTSNDLDNLEFSGRNIREGYYLIWNKENIQYDFDETKYDIIIHYKI